MRKASTFIASIVSLMLAVSLLPGATRATGAPSFTNFAAPQGFSSGEPSIGIDWRTGAVMYQSGETTARVTNFHDSTATSTWENVTPKLHISLDPILTMDHFTDRVFVSHLLGACAELAFSDNDGTAWTENPIGCAPGSVVDHQSLGAGPFPSVLAGKLPAAAYPDAVYYCTHAAVTANCGVSLDGGLSFAPATPTFLPRGCFGGHGHLKIATDGTTYLPHGACGGASAALVTNTLGASWSLSKIPHSVSDGEADPSIGIGSKGTVYFGYRQRTEDYSGRAYVAVSHDKGTTWTHFRDVGMSLGIQNIQFPSMVAGDDDRAAFAFLGTTKKGLDQSPSFNAVWHLYVATTYDGGNTWTTVDATPNDPVQRGWICTGGIGCSNGRNLLDFMDIDIDASGRIYVAYADGCVPGCKHPADSMRARATIARQRGGMDLIAAR